MSLWGVAVGILAELPSLGWLSFINVSAHFIASHANVLRGSSRNLSSPTNVRSFVRSFVSNFGGHNLTEKEGTSGLYGQRNHLVLCRYLHDLVISCNSLCFFEYFPEKMLLLLVLICRPESRFLELIPREESEDSESAVPRLILRGQNTLSDDSTPPKVKFYDWFHNTVKTRLTASSVIQSPRYYSRFFLAAWQKPPFFLQKYPR